MEDTSPVIILRWVIWYLVKRMNWNGVGYCKENGGWKISFLEKNGGFEWQIVKWRGLRKVHRKTQVNHLTHLSHSGFSTRTKWLKTVWKMRSFCPCSDTLWLKWVKWFTRGFQCITFECSKNLYQQVNLSHCNYIISNCCNNDFLSNKFPTDKRFCCQPKKGTLLLTKPPGKITVLCCDYRYILLGSVGTFWSYHDQFQLLVITHIMINFNDEVWAFIGQVTMSSKGRFVVNNFF